MPEKRRLVTTRRPVLQFVAERVAKLGDAHRQSVEAAFDPISPESDELHEADLVLVLQQDGPRRV